MHCCKILLSVCFAWTLLAPTALAEPAPEKKLDLTFRHASNPDTWLKPNLRFDSAWFAGKNAWAGNAEQSIGDDSKGWGELGLVPALDGQLSLGEYGRIKGRLSGVFSATVAGLDWAGTNFFDGKPRNTHKITLEDFYLRWLSGDSVPSLGVDALDISIGAQQYKTGPQDFGQGFIFHDAGVNGGRRGGYWLGLRTAFQFTTIARLKTGAFDAEAMVLRSDDGGNDNTNLAGANFGYDFGKRLNLEVARVGLGYWNVFDSDDARRDGLNVLNARLELAPCRCLPGLRLTGEVVKENNGSRNDSWGAWGELGYSFEDAPWKPHLSYRYAWFSGDDLEGDNNAFDPLYYGFSDWNYWVIGEISGEWVAGNSNLQASIVQLRVQPTKSLTAKVFWIYQRLDQLEVASRIPPGGGPPGLNPRVLAVTDKDLAHEVDITVDWQATENLTFSLVGAVLVPLKGGEQFFGNDKTWGQFMFYWSLKI